MRRQQRGLIAAIVFIAASASHAGQITIAVPDAKDQAVIDARAAYNARTGESLTVIQWLKLVVRKAVVAELALKKEADSQPVIDAKQRAYQDEVEAQDQARAAAQQAADQGW